MILVTGGAYQGKTAYVMREYGIEEISDGRVCSFEEARNARCVRNYEDCISFTEELCRSVPDRIIIMREIGCGIVPLEKSERVWRENVGRCGCIIAANSEKVIRMVCGLPEVIKVERE